MNRRLTPALFRRLHSTSPLIPPVQAATSTEGPTRISYPAPFLPAISRLKLISVSTLSLSLTIIPYMLAVSDTALSAGGVATSCATMAASILSTSVVARFSKPYIATVSTTPNGNLILETRSMLGQARFTEVNPEFIANSSKLLINWCIPEERFGSGDEVINTWEVVSITRDKNGVELGRIDASWIGKDGNTTALCEATSRHAVRNFYVHEEFLKDIITPSA